MKIKTIDHIFYEEANKTMIGYDNKKFKKDFKKLYKVIKNSHKIYTAQFIDLIAERAYVEYVDLTDETIFDYTDVLRDDDVAAQINKESILNLKKQLK